MTGAERDLWSSLYSGPYISAGGLIRLDAFCVCQWGYFQISGNAICCRCISGDLPLKESFIDTNLLLAAMWLLRLRSGRSAFAPTVDATNREWEMNISRHSDLCG